MQSKRIPVIDLIRTLAIFCVILTHVTEYTYHIGDPYMFTAPKEILLSATMLHMIGRLGVPMFLFMSGYLLLDREFDQTYTIRFWKRNLLGLLLTTEIWIVIYHFFLVGLTGTNLDFGGLIREMLFLKQSGINHLWYMGQILGLYLFIPVVAMILKKLDQRIFCFLFIMSAGLVFLPPLINTIFRISGIGAVTLVLNAAYTGAWSGVMLVIGWMMKQHYFDRIRSIYLALIAIGAYLLRTAVTYVSYRKGIRDDIWYNSFTLLVLTVCLTVLLLRVKRVRQIRLVTWFGYASFAIYLCHNAFARVVAKGLDLHMANMPVAGRELILFLSTVFLSIVFVAAVSKSKRLSRILFFMR
jgi:surface polysaccharide O-acyltransferase-like enzyme